MNNKMAKNMYQQLNLKNKINTQNRNTFIDTENILMVARWKGVGGMSENGEGI